MLFDFTKVERWIASYLRVLVDCRQTAEREAKRACREHRHLAHSFSLGQVDGINIMLESFAREHGWDRYQFFAALEADRREREARKDQRHGVDRWFTRGADAAAQDNGAAAQELASSPAELS
jgi:hypothetical protein